MYLDNESNSQGSSDGGVHANGHAGWGRGAAGASVGVGDHAVLALHVLAHFLRLLLRLLFVAHALFNLDGSRDLEMSGLAG